MKVFTYSQARQRLSTVLDTARGEKVLIKRRGGETFCLTHTTSRKSPFDVPGIETRATTADILKAIGESRSRSPRSVAHSVQVLRKDRSND
jgi:hypothetical protein